MIKNNLEIDVKVKCLEEGVTQAQLAQMVGTSAPYVSRLINKKEGIINKIFVDMLDKLGYDIQLVFFWLGAMWVNIHNQWSRIEKIDNKVICVSLSNMALGRAVAGANGQTSTLDYSSRRIFVSRRNIRPGGDTL